MTDIIEQVAEAIYDNDAIFGEDGPYSSAFDAIKKSARKQATAALEELAKGLVWVKDGRKWSLFYGVVFIHKVDTVHAQANVENHFRKQLFGLGPKEE